MIRQAVILCGGVGSRLGDLTAHRPKPLLEIDAAPFLDVLLFELARHGVKRVLLLAGFKGDQIADYARSTPLKVRFGLEIAVSVEPNRAATGGATRYARDRLEDVFFLLNGDSWFNINILELTVSITEEPTAIAAIASRRADDPSRFGVVELDGQWVTRFHYRPHSLGPGHEWRGLRLSPSDRRRSHLLLFTWAGGLSGACP